MRHLLLVFWMLMGSATSVLAQVSVGVGIGLPGVSIGINLPAYPELVPVPGYPVYYAPRLSLNFFFYDGLYWLYQNDYWYAAHWYNGPWWVVDPFYVPLYILRVPVRYYRAPPPYFYGWRREGPPRWGERYGHEWQQHRPDWERRDRRSAPMPAPAPLPHYQRPYSGDLYPQQTEQQQRLRDQNYRHQPRDAVVLPPGQEPWRQRAPTPIQRVEPGANRETVPRPQEVQRPNPPAPPRAPVIQDQQPMQAPPMRQPQPQPQPGAFPREPGVSRPSREQAPPGMGAPQSQEPRRSPREGQDRFRGEERGHDRNR